MTDPHADTECAPGRAGDPSDGVAVDGVAIDGDDLAPVGRRGAVGSPSDGDDLAPVGRRGAVGSPTGGDDLVPVDPGFDLAPVGGRGAVGSPTGGDDLVPVDPGFDLAGRRALVTGASAGIGAAIALRLARSGASVVAVSRSGSLPDDGTVSPADRSGGPAEASSRLVPMGRGALAAVAADLSLPAEVDVVVERAVAILGGLDIVVNNAGRGDWRPVVDLDRGWFDDLVELNLWAPLRICQLAHPHLCASHDAAVVMIGSVDAVRPSAGGAVYGATKAALGAVTVALAKEWREDAIRVTQVDPGMVATPMSAPVVAQLEAEGFGVNIVGRAGTGDEIAGLVHYLVAPVGRFATGVSLRVDGGAVAMGPFDLRT